MSPTGTSIELYLSMFCPDLASIEVVEELMVSNDGSELRGANDMCDEIADFPIVRPGDAVSEKCDIALVLDRFGTAAPEGREARRLASRPLRSRSAIQILRPAALCRPSVMSLRTLSVPAPSPRMRVPEIQSLGGLKLTPEST